MPLRSLPEKMKQKSGDLRSSTPTNPPPFPPGPSTDLSITTDTGDTTMIRTQTSGEDTRLQFGEHSLARHVEAYGVVEPQQDDHTLPHPQSVAMTEETGQIPPCMIETDGCLYDLMISAPLSPPITLATLQELDLQWIQSNLNLRIDICYDHDLYFQPISGRKGDVKRKDGERYWSSLAAEFRIYWHRARRSCETCPPDTYQPMPSFPPRLPHMFHTLKEIVEMLVPDEDHQEVASHLDVHLLMQQVRAGLLDAVRLSEWLANLLTSHCAPMRDEFATEITSHIRTGMECGDTQVMAQGLEKLFNFLEAMKLDVANHQVRALRYTLIQDTVPFQQSCFSRAIESGHFSIRKPRQWYRQARFNHEQVCPARRSHHVKSEFASFVHAMVRLCDPREARIPATFQYDLHRFSRLQEDVQDLVQMNLCLMVHNQRIIDLYGEDARPVGCLTSHHGTLQSRLICLTEDEDGNGGAISDHLDAIGLEITRAVLHHTKCNPGGLVPISQEEVDVTIGMLRTKFLLEDDVQTQECLMALEQETMRYATQFLPMSTLEVSNVQRQWTQGRLKSMALQNSLLADMDDIARRLAHIGVVHWHVWADLCYLNADVETETEVEVEPHDPDAIHVAETGWLDNKSSRGDESLISSASISASTPTLTGPRNTLESACITGIINGAGREPRAEFTFTPDIEGPTSPEQVRRGGPKTTSSSIEGADSNPTATAWETSDASDEEHWSQSDRFCPSNL